MADSTVNVAFTADTSGLRQGLDQVSAGFKNIDQSADTAVDVVVGLFTSIEQASGSAVKGILQGTQTWQQAMHRAAVDILSVMINNLIITPEIEWIKSEAVKTAASEVANSERVASGQAANDASLAGQAEKVVASIFNDAKQVFSGIFAFLAPSMGPAAAGPAAAGSAVVASLAGEVVYAENGAWNIPANTLAYLHAGEMVVPANFASGLRGGATLGGSGDAYTININAIDTQTGTQFLRNNAGAIASALSSQARNFSRNVPVWKS